MIEPQESGATPSICEIAGCTDHAVSEIWSIDENRHLQVCWKHEDLVSAEEADGH